MRIIELPIEFEFNEQTNRIYPSLIVMGSELTLVDTGYPNFMPLIESEIVRHGFELENLKNIIITHFDDDHIGSLYDFKEKYPSVRLIASGIEAPSIRGERKSERLMQAEAMLETMPEGEKEFGHWFIQQLTTLKTVEIDEKVSDGDLILQNQCKIIATPGHTSGHISLYFPALKSVITGDAAICEHRQLEVANPHFCLDLEKAEQSLENLRALKATTYYCYHGGTFNS
ncbi:MBL fold metallo-hydrolase [Cytobacillus spongiae]|jgi:glyoxylase-like metal-dependent hydrolase (beta-lactamase superfamily II)|uniref:MBL fold metallo-hydrolase n=1 Tax=Cytobacillus spongiae TaxID=2901381 RepID=UPI001F42E112|nr:MBL fold metallo-hydrolase [Cytobacillus spongiae]UII56138.1 MBL fold metallo-hydrolase [Cytobacillus spongiae]